MKGGSGGEGGGEEAAGDLCVVLLGNWVWVLVLVTDHCDRAKVVVMVWVVGECSQEVQVNSARVLNCAHASTTYQRMWVGCQISNMPRVQTVLNIKTHRWHQITPS